MGVRAAGNRSGQTETIHAVFHSCSFNSILWDWQVYYLSGCAVVALYAFYLHDSCVATYHRWALQHRSEIVLDRAQVP